MSFALLAAVMIYILLYIDLRHQEQIYVSSSGSIDMGLQGCCLTGARAPGRLGRLSSEPGRLKFSSRSPSGRLNMEFSLPSNLSGDFNLLKKSIKKSLTRN